MKKSDKISDNELLIVRGLLDTRPRMLVIDDNQIKFENKDLISDSFTEFSAKDITDYRYGIKWIEGLKFTIGREYQFFVKNNNEEIIKIHFKSFYGYKKTKFFKLFQEINNRLWQFHFGKFANTFYDKFLKKEPFQVGEVKFTVEHITIKVDGLLSLSDVNIEWENVGIRDYETYFAIYSKLNPKELNRGYSYLDDWNTTILYSVINTIIDSQN